MEKDRLLTERIALLSDQDVMASERQLGVRNNLKLVSALLCQQFDLNKTELKLGLQTIAQRRMSLAKVYDQSPGNGLSR